MIDTALSVKEIIASLDSQTEPKKGFRFGRGHTIFQGTFSCDGFKIARIIRYRNSLLPIIRGTYAAGPSGTAITIKMRPHPFVTAFICFWFAGVGFNIFKVLAGLSPGQADRHPMLLRLLGMLVFAWVFWSGSFWYEVKQGKPLLLEMFSGRERQIRG